MKTFAKWKLRGLGILLLTAAACQTGSGRSAPEPAGA